MLVRVLARGRIVLKQTWESAALNRSLFISTWLEAYKIVLKAPLEDTLTAQQDVSFHALKPHCPFIPLCSCVPKKAT